MVADCTASGEGLGNVRTLYWSWIEHLQSTQEVHRGPVATKFKRLPGVRFDVVQKIKDDHNDPIFLRVDAHVVSDHSSRFIYSTRSKEVMGKGNSGLVKKMDISVSVTKDSDKPNTYRFRLQDALAVERPWYAPPGIFLSELSRQSLEGFSRTRDRLMTDLVSRMKARPSVAKR